MASRFCNQCGKALAKNNSTRVCDEDCFYGHILWGTKDDLGVLVGEPKFDGLTTEQRRKTLPVTPTHDNYSYRTGEDDGNHILFILPQ